MKTFCFGFSRKHFSVCCWYPINEPVFLSFQMHLYFIIQETDSVTISLVTPFCVLSWVNLALPVKALAYCTNDPGFETLPERKFRLSLTVHPAANGDMVVTVRRYIWRGEELATLPHSRWHTASVLSKRHSLTYRSYMELFFTFPIILGKLISVGCCWLIRRNDQLS